MKRRSGNLMRALFLLLVFSVHSNNAWCQTHGVAYIVELEVDGANALRSMRPIETDFRIPGDPRNCRACFICVKIRPLKKPMILQLLTDDGTGTLVRLRPLALLTLTPQHPQGIIGLKIEDLTKGRKDFAGTLYLANKSSGPVRLGGFTVIEDLSFQQYHKTSGTPSLEAPELQSATRLASAWWATVPIYAGEVRVGTGVIASSRGVVLTCSHVVETKGDTLSMVYGRKEPYPLEIARTPTETGVDVAVLQLKKGCEPPDGGFVTAAFANQKALAAPGRARLLGFPASKSDQKVVLDLFLADDNAMTTDKRRLGTATMERRVLAKDVYGMSGGPVTDSQGYVLGIQSDVAIQTPVAKLLRAPEKSTDNSSDSEEATGCLYVPCELFTDYLPPRRERERLLLTPGAEVSRGFLNSFSRGLWLLATGEPKSAVSGMVAALREAKSRDEKLVATQAIQQMLPEGSAEVAEYVGVCLSNRKSHNDITTSECLAVLIKGLGTVSLPRAILHAALFSESSKVLQAAVLTVGDIGSISLVTEDEHNRVKILAQKSKIRETAIYALGRLYFGGDASLTLRFRNEFLNNYVEVFAADELVKTVDEKKVALTLLRASALAIRDAMARTSNNGLKEVLDRIAASFENASDDGEGWRKTALAYTLGYIGGCDEKGNDYEALLRYLSMNNWNNPPHGVMKARDAAAKALSMYGRRGGQITNLVVATRAQDALIELLEKKGQQSLSIARALGRIGTKVAKDALARRFVESYTMTSVRRDFRAAVLEAFVQDTSRNEAVCCLMEVLGKLVGKGKTEADQAFIDVVRKMGLLDNPDLRSAIPTTWQVNVPEAPRRQ